MASNKNDDENDCRSTSSDRQRHAVDSADDDDPARDFMPPRNYVRQRQIPIYHSPTYTGRRDVDEGLAAWKAVSDQLSRGNARQRTSGKEGNNRKSVNQKSSASSISSAGGNSNLNDACADLIRGPVGSFAEDSPIRERDSPNASYRTSYAMAFSPPYESSDQHGAETQDQGKTTDKLFAKWSTRLPLVDSKLVPAKASPTSKNVTTDWNDMLQHFDDSNFPFPSLVNDSSPSKVALPTSKKHSTQDVFRSPPTHDLKKRHQLLSSPSFSFGGIETPGAASNGFSPVPTYPSDDEYGNDGRKFTKLRFQPSFDDDHPSADDEQVDFIPSFLPTSISSIPKDELAGVRRSPILSSSERKSSSTLPRKDDVEFKGTRGKKSGTPSSKSSKKKTPKKSDANLRTPWTDVNVDCGSTRRVTMGEPQSSRSLADINNMMRRGHSHVEPTASTPPKPKTPGKKKSLPASNHTTTKQATQPVRSDSVPPVAQAKVSATTDIVNEQKQEEDQESAKSNKMEITKTSETTNEYSYPYRHNNAVPHHYGTYPPSAVAPFHHEYHARNLGATSQHMIAPVHYPHHQSANLPMHFAPHPSGSPHIPPRYHDRQSSPPAIPSTYAMPVTPRFQHGYGVHAPSGPNSMYSASHTRMSGPPPPYGWPIPTSAPSTRYSSPSLHHSSLPTPSGSRPAPGRLIGNSMDKENSNNKSVGSSAKSKRNPCNCKKSRCLKLYCECFSAQNFCDGCNCIDCYNTEGHVDIREKAMKELLHKNKAAFDVKTPGAIAIGCKCKRSECLKKYCECFQAGVVCVDQCKCVSCSNRAGSQKLIDKRRKMKDTKGAEYAMQISKEVWEQQPRVASVASKPPILTSKEATVQRSVVPHFTGAIDKFSRSLSTKSVQLGPPTMGNVEFSPMENNVDEDDGTSPIEKVDDKKVIEHTMATPAVISSVPFTSTANGNPSESIPINVVTVTDSVNKLGTSFEHSGTPAGVRRLSFDSTITDPVKKRQKQCIDDKKPLCFFGSELPPLPSSIMTIIFRFLPEVEIIQTSQVCTLWKSLQSQ